MRICRFAGVRAVPVWIAAVNVLCTAAGGKDRPKNFRILCYFYVLLFGCNSSLVLSGFAVLGIWAVWEIVTLVDKRKQFSAGQAAAWGILLLTYIVENGSLLLQLSGGQGEEISHKSEYLLSPVDFSVS